MIQYFLCPVLVSESLRGADRITATTPRRERGRDLSLGRRYIRHGGGDCIGNFTRKFGGCPGAF